MSTITISIQYFNRGPSQSNKARKQINSVKDQKYDTKLSSFVEAIFVYIKESKKKKLG